MVEKIGKKYSLIIDRISLINTVANLKDEDELIITIPGMSTSEIINFFQNSNHYYFRTGFKKWKLVPKTSIFPKEEKFIVLFRLFCLVCTIILFILSIYSLLSLFWTHLESYLISLPLASGILSGLIFAIISALGQFIFKKDIVKLFKSFLGVARRNGN